MRRLQSALGYLGELIDEGSAAALADAAGDANALAADLRFRHTGDPDALLHLDVITLAIERAASLGLAADRGASPIAKPSTTTSR